MDNTNTWMVSQWFDIEQSANQVLLSTCRSFVSEGRCFDRNSVSELMAITECPVSNVNVEELVDQFNELLHTLH